MSKRVKSTWMAKALSAAGLLLLALGFWADRPVGKYLGHEIWLADLMPVVLVVPFGLWRLATERKGYQRVRLVTILGLYFSLWVAFPMFLDPWIPTLAGEPERFPAIHAVGSLSFFAYGAAMLFFGKRLDCGWNCPCVTTRETVAYAFRDVTPRGHLWWALRWLKWLPGGLLLLYLVLLIFRPEAAYNVAGRPFYSYISYTYFYSFLAVPLLGNRSYCRWLCPYAAFWGWLSYIGVYRIRARREICAQCHACEKVCDMGIPIADLVTKEGQVKTVECMGCGRCIEICPHSALSIESAAKWWTRSEPKPEIQA